MGIRHWAPRTSTPRRTRQSTAELFLVAIGCLLLSVAAPASQADAATITVTTVLDDNPSAIDGEVSLREAIDAVNAGADLNADVAAHMTGTYGTNDTIRFIIGSGSSVQTIVVDMAGLPSITNPVVIDGTTQPGYSAATGLPRIELNGAAATASDGLRFEAPNVTVKALTINRFGLSGIFIDQPNGKIYGSYIGVDNTGTVASANGSHGIAVEDSTSAGTTSIIGGTDAGERNVISGNSGSGIFVCLCARATIVNNYIGVDNTGTSPLGNQQWGVFVNDAKNVTIGGTATGAGNVISANVSGGINIAGTDATGATIQGNYIGPNAAGTLPFLDVSSVPLQDIGIQVLAAPGVVVGGNAANARNVISGNVTGISISGSDSSGANIQGNYIGVDKNGTSPLGNSVWGVMVDSAPNATIGGTATNAGNVISGNGNGVYVLDAGATGVKIQGNFIGPNAAGTLAIVDGNGDTLQGMGVKIENAPGVLVGGTATNAGNVISGNVFEAVNLFGVVTGTTIAGNLIGPDKNGTTALGNMAGVYLLDVSSNVGGTPGVTVGGTSDAARNVISGNAVDGGIQGSGVIVNGTTSGAVIAGNAIGIGSTGNPLPNLIGVGVNDGTDTTIGGTAVGAGNIISGNLDDGIQVVGMGVHAAILGNSIFDNGGLGIDLNDDGVTANDALPGDGDTGPNDLQNFPVVTAAITSNGSSRVAATLNSQAGSAFVIELFSNPGCDAVAPNNYGEGKVFLGRFNLNTDGMSNGSVIATVPAVTVGQVVTATATSSPGNLTSEFARCQAVAAPGLVVVPTGGVTSTVEGGPSDTFDVSLNGPPSANVTVALASSATGLASFAPSSTLTFTPANWSTPQSVTVTSVEDQVFNVASYSVLFTVTSTDAFFNGISVPPLAATHTENDPLPTISIADAGRSEPTSGSATLDFTVTLSRASGSQITVQFATANVGSPSATGGAACGGTVDYVTTSGTLTFAPLETSKATPVTVCADALGENPERFIVTLSGPSIGTLARATATGTIQDGTPKGVSIGDVTVTEGNSGTTTATFPVTLSPASAQVVTVQYATANGTAWGVQDYEVSSGTLTFQPGETSKSIAVNVVGDTLAEPDETFTVSLSAPTAGATLGRAQATGTITNDDAAQACTPKPATTVATSTSGGQLRATITSAPFNTGTLNPIRELRFGTLLNARVTLNGQTVASGQTVTVAANTSTLELIVTRATPGQATTVPFTVVDGCGEHATFVGGGPGAGF